MCYDKWNWYRIRLSFALLTYTKNNNESFQRCSSCEFVLSSNCFAIEIHFRVFKDKFTFDIRNLFPLSLDHLLPYSQPTTHHSQLKEKTFPGIFNFLFSSSPVELWLQAHSRRECINGGKPKAESQGFAKNIFNKLTETFINLKAFVDPSMGLFMTKSFSEPPRERHCVLKSNFFPFNLTQALPITISTLNYICVMP